MARFEITFKRSVTRDLRSIPRKDVKRILSRIEGLADDPRPHGAEKLSAQARYRVRQGVYRILSEIHDHELVVVVVKVAHRPDMYR